MLFPNAIILIFAKEPVPGKVKTRLKLNDELSAEVFSYLLTQVVSKVVKANIAPVELCVTGDKQHPLFQKLIKKHGIGISAQQGKNLGDKMANAIENALLKYQSVVLVGSDCLELTGEDIKQAFKMLQTTKPINVIQPAFDGGFVLIAVNQFESKLFDKVKWGTDKVLKQVLKNKGSTKIELLRVVSDIDEIEDLVKALITKTQYLDE